jgi:hypothetical protein
VAQGIAHPRRPFTREGLLSDVMSYLAIVMIVSFGRVNDAWTCGHPGLDCGVIQSVFNSFRLSRHLHGCKRHSFLMILTLIAGLMYSLTACCLSRRRAVVGQCHLDPFILTFIETPSLLSLFAACIYPLLAFANTQYMNPIQSLSSSERTYYACSSMTLSKKLLFHFYLTGVRP